MIQADSALWFAGQWPQGSETGALPDAVRHARAATRCAGISGGFHDPGGAGGYHALFEMREPAPALRRRSGATWTGVYVQTFHRATGMRRLQRPALPIRHTATTCVSREPARRLRDPVLARTRIGSRTVSRASILPGRARLGHRGALLRTSRPPRQAATLCLQSPNPALKPAIQSDSVYPPR